MTSTSDPKLVRLSKLMSERGLSSRREADDLIARGLVMVNGVIVDQLGTKVDPNSEVTLLDQAHRALEEQRTFVLYKPVGWVSGQPEDDHPAAVELITLESRWESDPNKTPFPKHAHLWLKGLAPAGRLDIESEGLLLLTQNGRVAKQVIGPDAQIEKEYLVRFDGELTKDKEKLLGHGLSLDGKKLKPATVEPIDSHFLKIVLVEGKRRQIRRMFELVDLRVLTLKRVRIGRLTLGSLPKGKWRLMSPEESLV